MQLIKRCAITKAAELTRAASRSPFGCHLWPGVEYIGEGREGIELLASGGKEELISFPRGCTIKVTFSASSFACAFGVGEGIEKNINGPVWMQSHVASLPPLPPFSSCRIWVECVPDYDSTRVVAYLPSTFLKRLLALVVRKCDSPLPLFHCNRWPADPQANLKLLLLLKERSHDTA